VGTANAGGNGGGLACSADLQVVGSFLARVDLDDPKPLQKKNTAGAKHAATAHVAGPRTHRFAIHADDGVGENSVHFAPVCGPILPIDE
jgi:hypothetical protein